VLGVPRGGFRLGRPTGVALRWIRGSVVGLSSILLAAVGHLAAGGMRPDGRLSLCAAVIAACAGVALSGRRWRLPSLLGVLLGAQLVYHVSFGGMSGDGTRAPTDSMCSMGAAGAMCGTSAGWMIAMHVCAAVLTAMVLLRAESWCWTVVEVLTWPVRSRGALPPLAPPEVALRPSAVAFSVVSSPMLEFVQPRRGPPTATAN
jgi:hypothetical protein